MLTDLKATLGVFSNVPQTIYIFDSVTHTCMAISSLDKKKVSDLKMSLKPIFFLHMYYIFGFILVSLLHQGLSSQITVALWTAFTQWVVSSVFLIILLVTWSKNLKVSLEITIFVTWLMDPGKIAANQNM